jgi:chemotaxis protein CheD
VDVSGRYGSYAMELLINEMMKLGARRETLQAKIFGGGQVMANFTTMNVGERNTRSWSGLPGHRAHTGGVGGCARHLSAQGVFFPVTGKAMVKRLAHAHPEAVAQEKRGNAASVATSHQRAALWTCFETTEKASDMKPKIRVVVVDDSALVRSLLAEIINRQA